MFALPTTVPSSASITAQLAICVDALLSVADLLDERPESVAPPQSCERRGWVGFLRDLSETELTRAEAHGLAAVLRDRSDVPQELKELAQAATRLGTLPRLVAEGEPQAIIPNISLESASVRKQHQLRALLCAVKPMAERATRIVDVGAGRGHLTRLSAAMFERDVLGIERDEQRVRRASARHEETSALQQSKVSSARFVIADACALGLRLRSGDLAVGLHACGELGDWMVRAAGEAGSDMALVSCCLQKVSGRARLPLTSVMAPCELRREVLGLANLTPQVVGVEAPIEAMIASRVARYGLRRLLLSHGVEVRPGAEMRGINRRQARAGLGTLAEHAFAQRGLRMPSSADIERHETEAREHQEAIRRWSLPRNMLARLIEVAVALDRARYLEERGYEVRVVSLFEPRISPRNIGIFASRDGTRLPHAIRRAASAPGSGAHLRSSVSRTGP